MLLYQFPIRAGSTTAGRLLQVGGASLCQEVGKFCSNARVPSEPTLTRVLIAGVCAPVPGLLGHVGAVSPYTRHPATMISVWWRRCSRQVTGQADLIAYGSHSVGGGTDGVDAEAICVTCADHTPGEEVTFDPLGKVQCVQWLLNLDTRKKWKTKLLPARE